ncbi:MAG: cytochrome-c peroxidase [Bacteroidia bacterium]
MSLSFLNHFAITSAIIFSCKPAEEEILKEIPTETPPTDAEILGRNLNLPATLYNYALIALPRHFNAPPVRNADNTPATNPITDAGATLGRVLFYDKKLSYNQTKSCASCHAQEHAFADPVALSEGFCGWLTGRNSMGLSNARFYLNGHFSGTNAPIPEDQTLMPIQDHVEMGMTLDSLTAENHSNNPIIKFFSKKPLAIRSLPATYPLSLSQFVRSHGILPIQIRQWT